MIPARFRINTISVAFSSQDHISLFKRLLEGELSPRETEALIEWLGNDELDPSAKELILQQLGKTAGNEQVNPAIVTSLKAKLPSILEEANARRGRHSRILKLRWLRYAAVIVICFGIGAYLLLMNKPSGHDRVKEGENNTSKIDVSPGKEGAILTFDDGSTVVLDSMGNGVITTKEGAEVKLSNGLLSYNASGAGGKGIAYNTMTTPKGRQFRLQLQDGTTVWLNAASSIRYPIVFTGKERKVEITGEAYFEVAKNARRPFHVSVDDRTDIEVLGTHFNINSYKNEATVNTTLLEGSVRIKNENEKVVLKPGQQARVTGKSAQHIDVVSGVDMEKVMAWKNGVFNFQDATLRDVMRQLERWYDIEVVYEKGVPELEFVGKMGRDLTLSEVLRGLEVSKVHFRLEEGRRLVVMP